VLESRRHLIAFDSGGIPLSSTSKMITGIAMYKVLHFIKRKKHLSHEQFKEHFERSHAPMALKFCGHLFSEYRRNYVNVV
jgi:hypothetical protein